jgi:GntR family transcriptional regulator/MocR family aminotransferase
MIGQDATFAVEDPCYEKIRRVYTANGVKIEPLRMGADGIRSDELARSGADALHVTPFHSFPSGISASPSKRQEYLRWVAERGRLLVEDDFDSEFSPSPKAEDTLFSADKSESVIYLNTFSKTIAPSIRISYMILPPHLMAEYRSRLSFYACTVSSFEQYTLAAFMAQGRYEQHINRMRNRYRQKRDAVIDAIRTGPLAGRVEIMEQDAGLHFLMHLNTDLPDDALRRAAAQKGVRLALLSDYYHNSAAAPQHVVVVNYSGIELDTLRRGLVRLAELWEE